MTSREDSRLTLAWQEFDKGDFEESLKLVLPFTGDDNLEALSLASCVRIEIGPWSEIDTYIERAGSIGGRDYWFAHQREQWIYAAFMARLDAQLELRKSPPYFLEQIMLVNKYLLARTEPSAFYYTVRAIRVAFATEMINHDLDAFADHLVGWIVEMKSRGAIDIEGINELISSIQMTFSTAFDGPTGFQLVTRIVEALE
jgi:hypothetical protein